jgi:hypothetical protein
VVAVAQGGKSGDIHIDADNCILPLHAVVRLLASLNNNRATADRWLAYDIDTCCAQVIHSGSERRDFLSDRINNNKYKVFIIGIKRLKTD